MLIPFIKVIEVLGKQRSLLALILVLVVSALVVISQMPARLGLDLSGGAQLTLQLQPTDKVPTITPDVLESVQVVIEGRINALGVSESVVQTVGNEQLLVQLPGVSDSEEAERVLGGTAQLEFRNQKPETEQKLQIEQVLQIQHLAELEELQGSDDADAIAAVQEKIAASQKAIADLFEPSDLTGENLTNAYNQPTNVNSDSWAVVVNFDAEGERKFAQLTQEAAITGRSLGIFLDQRLISAPGVDRKYADGGISGGSAEITGSFDAASSRELAVQLKGGSLRVPVEIVENRTVGATLGQDSIRRSVYAAVGGLLLVLIFMVVYYRLPGLIADIALCVYGLLTYSIFVLVGVTLTLPGIAGFILSIGMAVDANILIFERTREELRAGKTLYRSIESGFYRAFSSILDSNVTTLIACLALIWLGSGLVRGFAVTLAIGVCVSMFTAITCSRTLMFSVISFSNLRKPELFDTKKVKVAQ